ncbi:MAG: 50S ribosomal protein L4 [Candidatus Dadabacteria bacterium]|nr:50S ribosomal protein L4 [Candidatus Dadabacteria bacterium]NIS09462.1 50S ribosomal protein L4 [Candidatus Dadabacteria bacterium]NIV42814.1 50S ribosomal protein L4 [Candidatus Dadabacteria bacterium]NIX15974.1 50S ribosomal protein L4 [Candidatus Dadabacteria bacterium]NIY22712.1 50S ribosomal protein L4 [Candidatus Dadabacteria bacterium]
MADVYDINKKKVKQIDLEPTVFEAPVNRDIIHRVINWQLAKRRSGTACTKTRGEVRGGGAKPWKQKHMGRARHGSTRSPIWRKGGVTFGPKPKDWSFSLPKKVRRKALLCALSHANNENGVIVLNELTMSEIKTKNISAMMDSFDINSTLVIESDNYEILKKSSRNLSNVKVLKPEGLNVYDILKFKNIVFTVDSLTKVQEVLKH